MSQHLDQMMMRGAVETAGVDSRGNILYNLIGNLDSVLIAIESAHRELVHHEMMHFWELGFVEFLDMDRSSPRARLTDKIFDRNAIENLSEEDQDTLQRLMKVFRKK